MIRRQLRITDLGFAVSRQTTTEQDGETLTGPRVRRAVGVGDHETLAEYGAAVRALLEDFGLTVVEQGGKRYLELDQIALAQWSSRP